MSRIKTLIEQSEEVQTNDFDITGYVNGPMITNTEIERKFLVINDDWKDRVFDSSEIIQAYISTDPAVRVRTRAGKATLTIKSSNGGMSRSEFEYDIPYRDAVSMIEMFGSNVITKIRHLIQDPKTSQLWEIDQFRGENSDLVIAEIELDNEEEEINNSHSWLGDEVTDDHRYYNSYLSKLPYGEWNED